MRYLTDYRLFEAADRTKLTIGEFLKKIGFANQPDRVIEWWNSNRKNIEIYYFPFSSLEPIGGVVFLGDQADDFLILANEEELDADIAAGGGFVDGDVFFGGHGSWWCPDILGHGLHSVNILYQNF